MIIIIFLTFFLKTCFSLQNEIYSQSMSYWWDCFSEKFPEIIQEEGCNVENLENWLRQTNGFCESCNATCPWVSFACHDDSWINNHLFADFDHIFEYEFQEEKSYYDNDYQYENILNSSNIKNTNIPKNYNICDKHCPPVKNQNSCGSCWAFSIIAEIEIQLYKQYGVELDLSEQDTLDCSYDIHGGQWKKYNGCNGGNMKYPYQMFKEHGIVKEEHKPYLAKGTDDICFDDNKRQNQIHPHIKFLGKGFHRISQNEEEMKYHLYKEGPIAITMNANSLRHHTNDILDCSSITGENNHAVVLVGYGENDKDGSYWIVRNSWGDSAHGDGYFKIRRGYNDCNIIKYQPFIADVIMNCSSGNNGCNNRGHCTFNTNFKCKCGYGFAGEFCELECPGGTNNTCNYNGVCDLITGECDCDFGWIGYDCSLNIIFILLALIMTFYIGIQIGFCMGYNHKKNLFNNFKI